MDLYDCLRLNSHVQTRAKNVTPCEHNSALQTHFFPLVKEHAEYRCVYIVRVMATRAPVAQNKPHVDHAAVTWVCFSLESRTEAAIKVVYCNGQGNTPLMAAPAQNNTEPPLTSIRPVPPAVCGSAGLGSWKDACFLASEGFVRCHRYARAKKFCSV